jgi:hypothetical protein
LPDSYQLRAQFSDGPAINPATVLAPAIKYYGEPTPYEFRPFLERGLRVHAPGRLDRVAEHKDGLAFTVRTWSPRPSWLLMNGFQSMPRVRIDGADTPLTAPHQFQSAEGRLILQIRGSPRIEVTY